MAAVLAGLEEVGRGLADGRQAQRAARVEQPGQAARRHVFARAVVRDTLGHPDERAGLVDATPGAGPGEVEVHLVVVGVLVDRRALLARSGAEVVEQLATAGRDDGWIGRPVAARGV